MIYIEDSEAVGEGKAGCGRCEMREGREWKYSCEAGYGKEEMEGVYGAVIKCRE